MNNSSHRQRVFFITDLTFPEIPVHIKDHVIKTENVHGVMCLISNGSTSGRSYMQLTVSTVYQ